MKMSLPQVLPRQEILPELCVPHTCCADHMGAFQTTGAPRVQSLREASRKGKPTPSPAGCMAQGQANTGKRGGHRSHRPAWNIGQLLEDVGRADTEEGPLVLVALPLWPQSLTHSGVMDELCLGGSWTDLCLK